MKYGELFKFDPIETVVQLIHADNKQKALELVRSFVVSPDIATRIIHQVIQNLQFEKPYDNKGLLITGNYGSGKSHMMSVLSAIAEYPEFANEIKDTDTAKAALSIAGKFKVVRTEIGHTEMSLRDIVTRTITEALSKWDISFTFPSIKEIHNSKLAFEEMMESFNKKFPDMGFLLVVDELLDYLRTRNESQLIGDLQFMREMGELISDMRFRFIAGVQEAIFDTARFQFASDDLNRVKDRFQTVNITRSDMEYIVSERLLRKNAHQQNWIRNYLTPFAKYFGDMNQRMDEFVSLFPVHPDYIDIVEQITVMEKREVLKTLSEKMREFSNLEVPTDSPGLIAFDSYWLTMKQKPELRAYEDIKRVMDASEKLENLIRLNYPKGRNLEFAARIIDALSIHRLTLDDITKAAGLTSEALRDKLCLFDPNIEGMDEEPSEFLRSLIETTLAQIHQTASGQFISATSEDSSGKLGGQYYLNPDKIVDYDAHIRNKAAILTNEKCDLYYFAILRQAMECTDQTYVSGYRIWKHELDWSERRTTRTGYLFFGAPNERSTAVPPRDFYLYFIPPLAPPPFTDELKAEEVFFRLVNVEGEFFDKLKYFAAAKELADSSSGTDKDQYQAKSGTANDYLVKWLAEHVNDIYEVTYQGKPRTLIEWLKDRSVALAADSGNFRDTINLTASICLNPFFTENAPQYPKFTVLLTNANRTQAVWDALRAIAGQNRTKQGQAVLDALGLYEDGTIITDKSPYAQYIKKKLDSKPQGQVLNRDELIEPVNGVEFLAPQSFRLEPELAVVVLAALVCTGEVVITIRGDKYDATNLEDLANLSILDSTQFKHISKPKDWNVETLKTLFKLLGMPLGYATQIASGDDKPLIILQEKIDGYIDRLLTAVESLRNGLRFWDKLLWDDAENLKKQEELNSTKLFLESIQPFNTLGKLKNLRIEASLIEGYASALVTLKEVEEIRDLLNRINPLTSYLSSASNVLPIDNSWVAQANSYKQNYLQGMTDLSKRSNKMFFLEMEKQLKELKKDYIGTYIDMHSKARLDSNNKERQRKLLLDPRAKTLSWLSVVKILPVGQYDEMQNLLNSLKPCPELIQQDIEVDPVCPHCGFRPSVEWQSAAGQINAAAILNQIDENIDAMLTSWTTALLANLDDPTSKTNLELLKSEKRALVDDFIKSKALPKVLSNDFVHALNEALSSLDRIDLKMDELKKALMSTTPARLEELKRRFNSYLDQLIQGRDAEKIRIMIE